MKQMKNKRYGLIEGSKLASYVQLINSFTNCSLEKQVSEGKRKKKKRKSDKSHKAFNHSINREKNTKHTENKSGNSLHLIRNSEKRERGNVKKAKGGERGACKQTARERQ